jgi:predicted ferric reductase/Ca2+-binding EF-hand superfamily protein
MTTLGFFQRAHVKSAFRSFAGRDLLIDYPEWKTALGIKNDFLIKRIFDLVDTDGTGFIDYDEFLVFASHLYSDDKRKRLEFIFRMYDLDDDGTIEKNDVRALIEASLLEQQVTLEEDVIKDLVGNFMRKADVDKDKKISLDEFIDVIGDYPGIDEQFSIYAANWLNKGKRFKAPKIKAANLLLQLRSWWYSRRREIAWTLTYLWANVALFTFTMHYYADLGGSLMQQIARGAGACLNFNLALVLLPMCKSFWTWVQHTSLERYLPVNSLRDMHAGIGRAIVALSLIHIDAHIADQSISNQAIVDSFVLTWVGTTGVIATLVLGVMFFFSYARHRYSREVFVATHMLYGVFFVAMLIHSPTLWQWLALPVVLYAIDCGVRLWHKTRSVRIVEIKALADGVTRVYFAKPKGFDFYPGDYLRLCINDISGHQWHPFTISAAPEASVLGVHVRNNGDWTGALHNLSRNASLTDKKWTAKIDGPYSAPSSKIERSNVAVLIAAGIGVTPFASVLQSIVLRHQRARSERSKPNQTIYFHWLNRSQHAYGWFLDLLSEAETELGSERFKPHIHLTSLTHDLTNIAMQVAMDAYHEKHDRDPITGLNAITSAGRPNWDSIFSAVSAAHPGEPVDVFFCGPAALSDTIRSKCRKHGLFYHEDKF